MDSYLAPVVRRYLDTLVGELKHRLPADQGIHIMESNGGVMSAASASQTPLQTLLSGPVGGAIGGKALSAATGRPNLICVDMGGTSFDASLIIDGLPSGSNETKLEGLPIQMSVVDIHVIGAGGGSIAWEEAGARDHRDRARDKARAILHDHRPDYLSSAQIAEIRARFPQIRDA